IETNTFSANREKLSKFGLESEVEAINRAGVSIARKAVGEDAYVVGAIGAIGGVRRNRPPSRIKKDYTQQIYALLDSGVDGLMLETFFDLEEMLLALEIAKKQSNLPVICQFAIDEIGRTQDGYSITDAFQSLVSHGADIVGFNCRSGPNGILRLMEKMDPLESVPYSVFPNAGMPDYVEGKFTYTATPQYFAENALRFADLGARLIGGCCGTTPEHIAAIAKAIHQYKPNPQRFIEETTEQAVHEAASVFINPVQALQEPVDVPNEPNLLELVKGRHTIIVELDPPRDLNISKFMLGCEALKNAGADAVTMADNSLAVTRMSNVALGYLAKQQFGIRPLLHLACRDRNLIGIQSHLMGLHALGMNHVLAITGDPVSNGDLPTASSVFDLTSTEVIRMIKQLNQGIAFSGKPLKEKANFIIGGALPNFKHIEKGVQRLEKKISAGADYIMTQLVYDHKQIEKLYECTRHLQVPVFVGIMPLTNGRNAEFLHNEAPGIQIPEDVRRRMANLTGEEGRQAGLEIARELIDTTMKYFHGIYLATPFLNYELTVELTQYVREKSN
ncbi:MAG TPA: bifunctional homocysteine S-methyltransferase/methylenetetrahydrofolate reductase, partial [Bacilli bacterium]